MDPQEFVYDTRNYAVAYFATRKIMSWGEKTLQIALMGLEFELRILPLSNPGDPTGPPILYLDLVYCGPDAVRAPETTRSNILARVVTVDPWEYGIVKALEELIRDAEVVLVDNPPWASDDDSFDDVDHRVEGR